MIPIIVVLLAFGVAFATYHYQPRIEVTPCNGYWLVYGKQPRKFVFLFRL
jgi:hypothetical protein